MTDSTLYLDHFELDKSPFRQEPDPGIYFQGAGHPAVLQSLLQDIREGKPLIKLTGGEGVGKTFLNLLITRKLSPEAYDIITLDHPVGSFEDLLRTICLALNQGIKDNSLPRKFIEEFGEILRQKKSQQKKLLLVIDEAEKIFLATLERLVKMICDRSEDVLQVLLIGRLELDHNLEQLRVYCSNVDIHAGYILEPLNLQETREYLQYRLHAAGIPGTKHLDVFSDPAVAVLYEIAGGNISLTNTLAENALKKASSMGLFQVGSELLVSYPQKGSRDYPSLRRFLDLIIRNKWWAAAAILLVLVVFAILSGREEKVEVPEPEDQFSLEDIIIEKPAINLQKEADLPQVEKSSLKGPQSPAPAKESPEIPRAEEPRKKEQTENVQPEARPIKAEVPSSPFEQQQEAVSTPAPEQQKDAPGNRGASEESGTRADSAEKAPIIVQADGRKKKGPVHPEQTKQVDEQASEEAATIFEERLRASSNWLAWAYRGGYTIQLMMLTAEDAEENLKNILMQQEYSAVRDDMYIIKRNSPPALFVYYGMFDTLEETRRVRDTLPSVLQGHQPYALSIKEALQKIEE